MYIYTFIYVALVWINSRLYFETHSRKWEFKWLSLIIWSLSVQLSSASVCERWKKCSSLSHSLSSSFSSSSTCSVSHQAPPSRRCSSAWSSPAWPTSRPSPRSTRGRWPGSQAWSSCCPAPSLCWPWSPSGDTTTHSASCKKTSCWVRWNAQKY